jgi:hypothetical protein
MICLSLKLIAAARAPIDSARTLDFKDHILNSLQQPVTFPAPLGLRSNMPPFRGLAALRVCTYVSGICCAQSVSSMQRRAYGQRCSTGDWQVPAAGNSRLAALITWPHLLALHPRQCAAPSTCNL